jgi:hypothetical protein
VIFGDFREFLQVPQLIMAPVVGYWGIRGVSSLFVAAIQLLEAHRVVPRHGEISVLVEFFKTFFFQLVNPIRLLLEYAGEKYEFKSWDTASPSKAEPR